MKEKVPVLRLENVYKEYLGEASFLALKNINLTIQKGEIVSIIGPSGSGKSTMMHLLGCLDIPTKGELFVEGQPVSKMNNHQLAAIRGDKIGFIFQAFNLAPSLSVYKNVELPLLIKEMPPAERDKIVRENLRQVGLLDKLSSMPSQLSGGQKQRVAIARALANNPPIILGDEPTGNLDSKSSNEVIDHIFQICKDRGITFILVTHDPSIAKLTDRIIRVLDGEIVEDSKRR